MNFGLVFKWIIKNLKHKNLIYQIATLKNIFKNIDGFQININNNFKNFTNIMLKLIIAN